MTTEHGYLVRSRVYLAQAAEEFDRDELGPASEKGWGTAVSMVKAVAEQRGWAHESHRDLFRVVNRLVDEIQEPDARLQFQVANSLHTNFYESWLERPNVQHSLAQVAQFVGRLEGLLAAR